jgi:ABC-type antimicrobial peptide transport system permease subunit
MAIPLQYNLRSLFYRRGATLLTLSAVALTVAILCVLLAVSTGFSNSLKATGRADNVLVTRASAMSEGESTIARDDVTVLRATPGIAKSAEGTPLVSAELYAALLLEKEGPEVMGGNATNVTLRGVETTAFAIRDSVKIVEGQAFKPGSRQCVVGRSLVGRIKNCRLGGFVTIANEAWEITGVIDAGGSAFDSEIWGDVNLLLQVFDRSFYNSVLMRVDAATVVGDAAQWAGYGSARTEEKKGSGVLGWITDRVQAVSAITEREYFEKQAGFLGGFLEFCAFFLITLMSVGALSGLTNTFLAAVAGRTREIGSMLAMGFRPWQVFVGFLLESMTLALMGGVVGILVALPIGGMKTGTTNWGTFTEQAFEFTIDGRVIATAMMLALIVGLLGGAIPAWRASRLKPVDALRRG